MNSKNTRKDPPLDDSAPVDLDADAKRALHEERSRKAKRGFWVFVNKSLQIFLLGILLTAILSLHVVAGFAAIGVIVFFVALGYGLAYSDYKKRE